MEGVRRTDQLEELPVTTGKKRRQESENFQTEAFNVISPNTRQLE
ncbi:6104_t:CDS:1, partial [Cetraspora pellucida]